MSSDPFHRLYHDQYRNNSAINIRGVHMDTLEVFLESAPSAAQRAELESLLRAWAGEHLVTLSWSRENHPVLELRAGYFSPQALEAPVNALGLLVQELRGHYAARLDEQVNPAAGAHRF